MRKVSFKFSESLLRVYLCILIMRFLAVVENMALFSCQDPRNGVYRVSRHGDIPVMNGSEPMGFRSEGFIKEGHYMLYIYGDGSLVT